MIVGRNASACNVRGASAFLSHVEIGFVLGDGTVFMHTRAPIVLGVGSGIRRQWVRITR